MIKLRPYQLDIARAVTDSVMNRRGLTLSVEIARQGGKNELSAIIELTLLTAHMGKGGTIIKASPTFKPQTVISMERLKQRLDDWGFALFYRSELGYIVHLGPARCVFLSADESANVVGHTADILLEIDEAQDISKDKYTKEFRPMGSPTNCTTVLYGTTWDETTLLEEAKQTNLELQKKDGIQRHFAYDWQEVARHNPAYAQYVESERARLGEDHPLFRTQYALLPIAGGGRLISNTQLAMLMGTHPRLTSPNSGETHIAGLDLAGQEETTDRASPSRDSTALTIARMTARQEAQILNIYTWLGTRHTDLWPQLLHILKLWRCRRLVVDATGIGEPTYDYLYRQLGPRVMPFKFTQVSKSELGFHLLTTVNQGNIRLWSPDGSAEHAQAFNQLRLARSQYRPSQTLNFFVDPSDGHDDILMSIALCAWALKYPPKIATGGSYD